MRPQLTWTLGVWFSLVTWSQQKTNEENFIPLHEDGHIFVGSSYIKDNLHKACKLVDENGVDTNAETVTCPGCSSCDIGPYSSFDGSSITYATFCTTTINKYLASYACAMVDDHTDEVLLEEACHDKSRKCDENHPVVYDLPDGTNIRYYFCEDDETKNQDTTSCDFRKIGFQQLIGLSSSEMKLCTLTDIVNRLKSEACYGIDGDTAARVVERTCCDTCNIGPVALTVDGANLDLFFCNDNPPAPAQPIIGLSAQAASAGTAAVDTPPGLRKKKKKWNRNRNSVNKRFKFTK